VASCASAPSSSAPVDAQFGPKSGVARPSAEATLASSGAPSGASVAAPKASASALASSAPPPLARWRDPEVVDALAKDCHWNPNQCFTTLSKLMPQGYGAELPLECQNVQSLACAAIFDQNCVPDACAHTDDDCVPECDKGCDQCAATCTASCDTCKARCSDDACRHTCAEGCADCHDHCLVALDHCTTGHCSEVSNKCFKEKVAEWDHSACATVCEKVSACVEKTCTVPPETWVGLVYYGDCAKQCSAKFGRACPDPYFDGICRGDPNAGVIFFPMRDRIHEAEKRP